MSPSFILTLIILAVLLGSLYYLVQAEGGISQWPRLAARVGINPQRLQSWLTNQAPQPTSTPSMNPFTSGTSRFSQGTCLLDIECFISGCSNEVCGNQKAISTCEYSPNFPNPTTHHCGCLKTAGAGKCGWTAR